MSGMTEQQIESYVPVYDSIPEEWEEGRAILVEYLKKITNSLNTKEIGFFLNEQLISGKQFIPGTANNQLFRTVFRTVINFGALPNNTTKSVAHGVTVNASFSLIDMYLSATDPVGLTGFSLQYWDNTGSSPITLNYTSTDVVVKTTANYSNFTTTYVVLEFIQEL
jgi:hypothetical protein